MRQQERLKVAVVLLFMVILAPTLLTSVVASAANSGARLSFQDVNPASSFNNTGAGAGGRVNGLAIAGNGTTLYAATEYGGLYRSTDVGQTWSWLTGHKPTVTWDVEVHPSDDRTVYASSLWDDRVFDRTMSGIQISRDRGDTWSRPASAFTPASSVRCPSGRRLQPAAWGIAVDRQRVNDVYAATNCGIAVSHTAGASWTIVDPKKNRSPSIPDSSDSAQIVDVVARNGIVDVCGTERHWRSTDAGSTWSEPATQVGGVALAAARAEAGGCSIAASPDEPGVMYAVVGLSIYETVNGGVRWRALDGVTKNDPSEQGRIPFIVTNDTSSGFDLWFGDVSLHSRHCRRPAKAAATRCPKPASGRDAIDNDGDGVADELDEGWTGTGAGGYGGGFTRTAGAHDDAGDLLFDSVGCPGWFSSDGGIYVNTDEFDPVCQTPAWREVRRPPHAWWTWSLTGNDKPGDAEDLFVGLQDDGLWVHNNAGGPTPDQTWTGPAVCCDVTDTASDGDSQVHKLINATDSQGRFTPLIQSCRLDADASGGCAALSLQPPGAPLSLPTFDLTPGIASLSPNSYVVPSSRGMFYATDVGIPPNQGPGSWTQMGTNTPQGGFCAVYVSDPNTLGLTVWATSPWFSSAGIPVYGCGLYAPKLLWRIVPAFETTWKQITGPSGKTSGFTLVSAHPTDGNKLAVAMLGSWTDTRIPAQPMGIFFTSNVGKNWQENFNLEAALAGNHLRGPTSEYDVNVSWPSLVGYLQRDPNVIVAAGKDAGPFLSMNNGLDWAPLRTPTSPLLPRVYHAYFDTEPGRVPTVFFGSMGTGVWRANLARTDLSLDQGASDVIETGGFTRLLRTVRNRFATPYEVAVFQQLPPNVAFDQSRSSPGCVFHSDSNERAVRCPVGTMSPGAVVTVTIAVIAIDDGNGREDCTTALIRERVYSNAIDANPSDNSDSTSVQVCR